MRIGDAVIFTVGKRKGEIWEVSSCDELMGDVHLVPVGSDPNMPRVALLASIYNVRLNNEIISRY